MSLNLFQILKYMYFLKKGTKDGVSYISNACCKANFKYLKSVYLHSIYDPTIIYDPKQESKHITYLDANNGYAVSQFLPTAGFKLIYPKSLTRKNILPMIIKDVF